ncbi:MAG TPA: hypothetical protein VEC19_09365 [Usitatibacter sp.]|nr:hypothetical protein [Usitatibacter sp.]
MKLGYLFRRQDPTAGWPPASTRPALEVASKRVGPLVLGDALERASAVGKPLRIDRRASSRVLEYEGYSLDFGDTGLMCASFAIEGKRSVRVDSHDFTAATTPLDAMAWLGDPTSDSGDGGLRWLDYERDGATLALEFDDGKLTCVQLYSEAYA